MNGLPSTFAPQLPNGQTQFAGLLGWPVAHSLSPALHTQWFLEAGLNALYLPFPVQQPQHFLEIAASLMLLENFLGANITIPFKRDALTLSGVVASERVGSCGAANTLYFDRAKGHWALENTDIDGVVASLQFFKQNPARCVFLILGAGGGAAAALAACRQFTGSVTQCHVVARNTHKATQELNNFAKLGMPPVVSELLSLESGSKSWPEHAYPIVINTLPMGHSGEANKVAFEAMHFLNSKQGSSSSKVSIQAGYFDMIYANTPALEQALKLGFAALNGRLMLETQARASFEIWIQNRS